VCLVTCAIASLRWSSANLHGGKIKVRRVELGQRYEVVHHNGLLLRHLFKFWFFGKECDPETGEHHLDYAICNMLMLRHHVRAYPEGDNRPPTDLTGFDTAWEDFNKCFDEEDFLEQNPEIKAIVEARKEAAAKQEEQEKE